MTPAPRPSVRELRHLYTQERSISAVANELGVAYETARQWLLVANVELRGKGRPSTRAEDLDVRQITARYKRGESIATLGKAFGVSPTTVRSRLLEAGVSLRPRAGRTD